MQSRRLTPPRQWRGVATILGAAGLVAALTLTPLPATATDAVEVDQGLADFRQGEFAEAFQAWQAASTAGDPRGALYVGVLYDSGLGVLQDNTKALEWYRRAADAGSAAGAFNVGVLYDAGIGVAQDSAQAATWYARAAASGFGRAEYNLALLYDSGTGVKRDRVRAAALYRSAASHGISAASAHLAASGQRFTGMVRKPQDTALQNFQQAQQVFLSRGPAEATQAVTLFRRAAEQHNSLAEYDLGYCYDHGLGVPGDQAQAYDWYRRAAADASNDALRSIAQVSADNMERQAKQVRQTVQSGVPPLVAP